MSLKKKDGMVFFGGGGSSRQHVIHRTALIAQFMIATTLTIIAFAIINDSYVFISPFQWALTSAIPLWFSLMATMVAFRNSEWDPVKNKYASVHALRDHTNAISSSVVLTVYAIVSGAMTASRAQFEQSSYNIPSSRTYTAFMTTISIFVLLGAVNLLYLGKSLATIDHKEPIVYFAPKNTTIEDNTSGDDDEGTFTDNALMHTRQPFSSAKKRKN